MYQPTSDTYINILPQSVNYIPEFLAAGNISY